MKRFDEVIKGLECCLPARGLKCDLCPYGSINLRCGVQLCDDVMALLEALEKNNEILRLLVEWAIESGFGYDDIPDMCEKYKDEISNMSRMDGLIHIARRYLEDGEA